MSKKTATKKKPTVDHDTIIANAFRRGQDERTEWYEKHIHEQFVEGPGGTKWLLSQVPEHIRQMETTASQAIRTHFERLTALESRSAPAEEWVPKVGDWANWRGRTDCGPHQVEKVGAGKTLEMKDLPFLYDWSEWTPCTPAEIADHKAKEEQRAKEAEWAKFDVLQPGDACRASYEEVCRLMKLATDGGLKGNIVHRSAVGIYLSRTRDINYVYSGFIENQTYPIAEWERRLRGTIAKRAEDERAKELAKPLEFGTRVKWGSFTGRVACEGPDHQNEYLVAYKPGNGSVWHSTWVHRCDLTVID